MPMFDTEPTSIAATVTYKKGNQIFSSHFLFLKTIRLVHFFQTAPHIFFALLLSNDSWFDVQDMEVGTCDWKGTT
jgi:hypothetical protein